MIRSLLSGTSLAMLLLAGFLLSGCQPEIPPAPRHVVVMCLDTVRYDSILGRNIDDELSSWLQSAVVFSNASSTAPWTMPAVSSFLTGLYPVEHGAGQFPQKVANLDTQLPSALDDSALTLADVLDANYFRTGAFISHPFFVKQLGLQQGFQNVHNRRGWFRDLDQMWQWADKIDPPNRMFGYLHWMEAHHRHTASPTEILEWLEPVDQQTLDSLRALHPENCEDPDSRRCMQSIVYEAAVLELRRAIAAVLAGLKERDLLKETLVVVYSDHGEEFWDHEEIQLERGEDPRAFTGLGHGQSMFEELLHVPLIVWHPSIEGQGVEDNVSLVDVMPSILAWLGIDTEGMAFSGQLFPMFRRNWFGSPPPRTIFASGIAYGPEQVAARKGHEKSIFRVSTDELEIYDLQADPLESKPGTDQGMAFEFESLTGDYLEKPRRIRGQQGDLDAGQIEDLKAIGYLQGVEEESGSKANESKAGKDGKDGTEH